jgi:glycine hydroxymethyltransferase
VSIADLTTTTTHKTLRGPRGGMILAGAPSELTRRVDAAVYPGAQGGPLMHVIAAKAVAFQEALQPEFRDYQRQVVANAQLLGRMLIDRGYPIVSGGTDNHMLLVDLTGCAITAERAERALEEAHIAVNRIAVPRDFAAANPERVSGLRIGTPAVTTRGFGETEMRAVGSFIADVLDAGGDLAEIERVRAQVLAMCARFPVYGEAAL